MSRLYEALKGASRDRAAGTGQDPLWEALNVDELAAPSTADGTHEQPVAAPELNGHSEHPAVMEMAFSAVEVDEPESDEIATNSQVSVDLTARLLPCAVSPAIADHYRRFRTKIMQQRELKPFKSLVVTSASPREGKTVTVMNLALTFAMLPNFKVIVVDGDLRRGNIGRTLGVNDDQPGLSNLFEGTARLEDIVLKSDKVPMHFIVRGRAQVHDLHTAQFAGHFRRLTEIYDLVLIDSPPANLLADVQLLAAQSDAVLLVARAFSTTKKALERAAQELSPFRIIGAVLNAGLTQKSGRYYGYY